MAGGRLGDIFGHKNILIFGMTLFNIATLACGLANDKIGLVVARAFQGLAAAFTIPAAQSLVALSFDDSDTRVKAFGAWGAAGSSGFVYGVTKHQHPAIANDDAVSGLLSADFLPPLSHGSGSVLTPPQKFETLTGTLDLLA